MKETGKTEVYIASNDGPMSLVILREHDNCTWTHDRVCPETGKPMKVLTVGSLIHDAMVNFCRQHYGRTRWILTKPMVE